MSHFPIYFLRHGQTDWNISRRIQGQTEQDLNQQGQEEAKQNGRTLAKHIDQAEMISFVASPMRRTRETMELVRSAMGLDPLAYQTDKRLLEISFGDWEGMTEGEIAQNAPDAMKARQQNKWHFLPPGLHAETYANLTERIQDWLGSVTQKTICVTHGGCLRSIFYLYGGLSQQEAANHHIFQDRILLLDKGALSWLEKT